MKYLKIISEDPDYVPYLTEEEDKEMCRNTELHLARNEGIKTGIKSQTLKIARNLKKSGLSLELISANTGLSLKELQTL